MLFAIPITAQKLYSSTTIFTRKNEFIVALDSLINQISTEMSYIGTSTTFYMYSLTSKIFRKEVCRIFSSLFICRCHKTNIVQPITKN